MFGNERDKEKMTIVSRLSRLENHVSDRTGYEECILRAMDVFQRSQVWWSPGMVVPRYGGPQVWWSPCMVVPRYGGPQV